MKKVLISYRHESDSDHPDHSGQVKAFGNILKAANLAVELDQFYIESHPGGPDEGWPKWCEDKVAEADKIIMIASSSYFRCYSGNENPRNGLGAASEINSIRNLLYDSKYTTSKLRIAYFDPSHLSNVPAPLKHLEQFYTSDPDQLRRLLTWLSEEAPPAVEITVTPAILWAPMLASYVPDLANRQIEFASFVKMIAGIGGKRALFFQGPGNYGKTTLMDVFAEYALQVMPDTFVSIDFKVNPSKEFVLDTLRLDLPHLLPRFARPEGTLGDLRQDLRSLTVPVLLLIDTFEKCSREAQYLCQTLLADLNKTPALRLVFAGQIVPERKKTLWSSMVIAFELEAIKNAVQWQSYTSRHFPRLTHDHIAAITSISGGVPGTQLANFMAVLADLPAE